MIKTINKQKKFLLILVAILFTSSSTIKLVSGRATYYADKFVGRKTASGEIYSHNKMTGASNFFKLGSMVEVTNLENCKSVIVKVNDRTANSTAARGVVIDLTPMAMNKLSKKGVIPVEVKKLEDE